MNQISASDDTDTNVELTCNPPSGSYFPIGSSVIDCQAKDDFNNLSEESFTITISDTTPPIINQNGKLEFTATGTKTPVDFSSQISATDNTDTDVPVTCNPPSGSYFPIGPSRIECKARDYFNNPAAETFMIKVKDRSPPTITVPKTLMIEAMASNGTTVSYVANATDGIDGPIKVKCSPTSGSMFPIGDTSVKCTARDDQRNTGKQSFVIKVKDTKPPRIGDLGLNTSKGLDSNKIIDFTVKATDGVDGPVQVSCQPPSGSSVPGNTTITCTAEDSRSNIATRTFEFVIN